MRADGGQDACELARCLPPGRARGPGSKQRDSEAAFSRTRRRYISMNRAVGSAETAGTRFRGSCAAGAGKRGGFEYNGSCAGEGQSKAKPQARKHEHRRILPVLPAIGQTDRKPISRCPSCAGPLTRNPDGPPPAEFRLGGRAHPSPGGRLRCFIGAAMKARSLPALVPGLARRDFPSLRLETARNGAVAILHRL